MSTAQRAAVRHRSGEFRPQDETETNLVGVIAPPHQDLYSLIRPLVLWFFAALGTCGIATGMTALSFAWSTSERMSIMETQLKERSANTEKQLERLQAQCDKILEKIDKIKPSGP